MKEGNLLRVLRVGHFEVLNEVISLSEECFAACGSRLVQMNSTAMNEALTLGCTIHVLRMLRGGARAGYLFLGNSSVWCVTLTGAGLPAPVAIGVLDPWYTHARGGGLPTHVPVLGSWN